MPQPGRPVRLVRRRDAAGHLRRGRPGRERDTLASAGRRLDPRNLGRVNRACVDRRTALQHRARCPGGPVRHEPVLKQRR